jgi:hypothetical protein
MVSSRFLDRKMNYWTSGSYYTGISVIGLSGTFSGVAFRAGKLSFIEQHGVSGRCIPS